MFDSCSKTNYNMPLTLEQHFKTLAQNYPSVQELYSLWLLVKKRIEDELVYSRGVFVNYSLHDGNHSRSIIQVMERFLGEERIMQLSATDIFMLLVCAYAHDYGMAQTFNKVYDILGSKEFEKFLEDMGSKLHSLEEEDAWAIQNLLKYLNEEKTKLSLKDVYFSIMLVLQFYIRPYHWEGVVDIEKDFQGIFEGHIKGRFIHGTEGIIQICMCHGESMKSVFKLSQRADGMVGDDYHPRFVAVMLQLGDLLDLDNGRFPRWFIREINQERNVIPRLSVLNYRKHEAISHLLITHKKIEIVAECKSDQDGYEVASLVAEWTNLLEEECRQMVIHWSEIAQPDFGRPPGDLDISVLVDGHPYAAREKKMQMQMSQERVMNLLEGTSIYQDKYVGIREMIQNAVDASLLQLWYDITQNRYISYGLSKNTVKDKVDLLDFIADREKGEERKFDIFKNYNITVEVIKDMGQRQVYVVVKDKGIGITPEDVEYIANIGASKEKNDRIKGLMKDMPKWLKPAGIFGIGLQSVFQISDCVEFYSRHHNQPEKMILVYSYGKNKGKIEVREVPQNEDGLYYDNSIPGTNVKIAIEPRKLISDGVVKRDHFIYYDPEFDTGDELDTIHAEICRVCENKIKESKCDYFQIYYKTMVIGEGGKKEKEECRGLRRSYFVPDIIRKDFSYEKIDFGENIKALEDSGCEFGFANNIAVYWDKESCRCYRASIRPCRIMEREGVRQVYFPEPVPNLYSVSYKFNSISNAETIYSSDKSAHRLHAGFLNWNILILDDNTTKYLNIDRDRLREDAINEAELIPIQEKILNAWCSYFQGLDSAKAEKRFKDSPEILLSLILLFYQYVSKEEFLAFMEPYQDFVSNMNLVLGRDQLPFIYLWDDSKLFQSSLTTPRKFMTFHSEMEQEEVKDIPLEMMTHFPRRLLNIESIYFARDLKLLYRFRLHKPDSENNAIQMSEAARLYDYMKVFEPYANQRSRIDFSTVQKKVFKPNKEYSTLLLSRYPHTFQKGNNFASPLDECIRGYILSPFDKDATNILKRGVEKGENIIDELVQHVLTSRQYEKCVNYILNYGFPELCRKEEMRCKIEIEYRKFIKDFGTLLCKNRSIVNEQFVNKE